MFERIGCPILVRVKIHQRWDTRLTVYVILHGGHDAVVNRFGSNANVVVVVVRINDARQTQPLHHYQQKQKIIDSFGGIVHLRVHPLSLLTNSRFS